MNILILLSLLRSLYIFSHKTAFIFFDKFLWFCIFFLLFKCCIVFINTFKFSYLQLCLALADLVLQMQSWQKPIVDLINRFGTSTANLWPLLEILTVLPEEASSRSLRYSKMSHLFDVIKITIKELQLFSFYIGWELIVDIICRLNLMEAQILWRNF